MLATMLAFPQFIKSNDKGHLCVEGVECLALAKEFGTPLFVISENQLRSNIKRFRKAFEDRYPQRVVTCVGMKSNFGLALRRIVAQEGAGGDAFGRGELYAALVAGTNPNDIVMNGCNKDLPSLRAAIQAGIIINVDGIDELDRIMLAAELEKKQARITYRMRPALRTLDEKYLVDPRFPSGYSIGEYMRVKKFGLEPQQLFLAYEKALQCKGIDLVGLMFHGGPSRRFGYHREEVVGIFELIKEMKERYGYEPQILNLGGGFVPDRVGRAPSEKIEDVASAICGSIIEAVAKLNVKVPQLYLEPGRWCVENAVIFLTEVGAIKKDIELTNKTWIYVNGNINENGDPFCPLGKYHEFVLARDANAAFSQTADVCGQLCNSQDILQKKKEMPEVQVGDILAMMDMGAYNESFAAQANAMPRSASVMVNGEKCMEVRRRETIQDVFARDIIPYWLY